MTEPGAGSDIRGMLSTAVRKDGDWIVNGTKHFISGADHADFVIVFVATGVDETPRGAKKRITAFPGRSRNAWIHDSATATSPSAIVATRT